MWDGRGWRSTVRGCWTEKKDEQILISKEIIENNVLEQPDTSKLSSPTLDFENNLSKKEEIDFFKENNELEIAEKKENNSDDELLEIPAFLRRQAN